MEEESLDHRRRWQIESVRNASEGRNYSPIQNNVGNDRISLHENANEERSRCESSLIRRRWRARVLQRVMSQYRRDGRKRDGLPSEKEKKNWVGPHCYANERVSWLDVATIRPIKRRAKRGYGRTRRRMRRGNERGDAGPEGMGEVERRDRHNVCIRRRSKKGARRERTVEIKRKKGQERAKASETRIFRRRWKREMRVARGKLRRVEGKEEREKTRRYSRERERRMNSSHENWSYRPPQHFRPRDPRCLRALDLRHFLNPRAFCERYVSHAFLSMKFPGLEISQVAPKFSINKYG